MNSQTSDKEDEYFVAWFKANNESEVISDGGMATKGSFQKK